jgi:hypothetical protein
MTFVALAAAGHGGRPTTSRPRSAARHLARISKHEGALIEIDNER